MQISFLAVNLLGNQSKSEERNTLPKVVLFPTSGTFSLLSVLLAIDCPIPIHSVPFPNDLVGVHSIPWFYPLATTALLIH